MCHHIVRATILLMQRRVLVLTLRFACKKTAHLDQSNLSSVVIWTLNCDWSVMENFAEVTPEILCWEIVQWCVNVNDSYHPKNEWCHVECWDVNKSSVSSFFSSIDGGQIMSLFQSSIDSRPSLFEDWRDLKCSNRWKVLQHMFYKNFTPNPSFVTMGNLVRYVSCNSYSTCQSSNTCSWSCFGYNHPELYPTGCNDCSKSVHHFDQIRWESLQGGEEKPLHCVDCHQGTQ